LDTNGVRVQILVQLEERIGLGFGKEIKILGAFVTEYNFGDFARLVPLDRPFAVFVLLVPRRVSLLPPSLVVARPSFNLVGSKIMY